MTIRVIENDYRHDSVKNSTYIYTTWAQEQAGECVLGPQKPLLVDIIPQADGTMSDSDPHFKTVKDETFAVGCVVEIISVCERIMSDVWENVLYAVYYDAQSGGFRQYALQTRGFENGSCRRTATVDASDDIKEAYKVWKVGKQFCRELAYYDDLQGRLADERKRPGKKKWVEVYKGRKVAKGTKGYVFWEGTDNWGNAKLGIAVSEHKNQKGFWADVVWVAAGNCKVTNEALFAVS